MTLFLILQILVFAASLWLGLYLLGRDLRNVRLRFAGLGLVAYALGLALDLLRDYASPDFALTLARLRWPLLFLPALCWLGALLYLLAEESAFRARLTRFWSYGFGLLAVLLYALSLFTELLVETTSGTPRSGLVHFVLAVLVLLSLLGAVWLVGQHYRAARPKTAFGVLIVAVFFFAASALLLFFPQDWLPREWVVFMVGFDLGLLGLAIAVLDAFDQGEALLPDFLRSLDFSFLATLLFGGQVLLAILLGTGVTLPMLALLLAIIASSIAVQIFAHQLQTWVADKLAYVRSPQIKQAQSELREVAYALPRLNEELDLETLDEAEFARLTRRALSNFGDLSRLAASPLTRLPIIEARLAGRGATGDPLERVNELKAVLTESIARLKPRGKGDFGASDEWRYYNALYFPYVLGLKPYSLRQQNHHLDPAARQALDWFRDTVPERTLYNWQTAAARLIAQDLRQRQTGVGRQELGVSG